MKKILALVLALAMVLSIASVYAETATVLTSPSAQGSLQTEEPKEFTNGDFTDTVETQISISGALEATADYFQLLEWEGSNNGTDTDTMYGWKLTALGETCGVTLVQLLNGITAAEAATIATNLANAAKTGSFTLSGGAGTATVEPGLYYVKITAANDSDYLYNPVFISADYYQGNNSIEASEGNMIGSSAVAKRSSVPFDKKVTAAVTSEYDAEHVYTFNDVKPGDVIPYQITSKIPAYGANYDKVKFEIKDTFSAGLNMQGDLEVWYGGQKTTASNNDVTISGGTDGSKTFTIAFTSEYLLDSTRPETTVVVTYTGIVTSEAISNNVNPMDNKADLSFSNSPETEKDKHDITRHYTFSIDGNILGGGGGKSSELLKTGVDKDGNPITSEIHRIHNSEYSPLADATFQLIGLDPNNNTINQTVASDANGNITFEGLDAGRYSLQELTAPNGFVKDNTIYTVTITPSYDNTSEDILTGYTVKFAKGNTELMTASFTATKEDTSETVGSASAESNSAFLQNRQGAELPSTGGIGTTIFYLVGGLMVLAAGIVLVSRKKAED